MTETPIQVGAPLRDAAVDPRPGDFIPVRGVRGHPGVTQRATAGEPEFEEQAKATQDGA